MKFAIVIFGLDSIQGYKLLLLRPSRHSAQFKGVDAVLYVRRTPWAGEYRRSNNFYAKSSNGTQPVEVTPDVNLPPIRLAGHGTARGVAPIMGESLCDQHEESSAGNHSEHLPDKPVRHAAYCDRCRSKLAVSRSIGAVRNCVGEDITRENF